MANIQGQKKWSDVRLLETHELARGGVNGNLNEQAKALADRTELLMEEKASKQEIVQGVFEFGTYAEFNAVKSTLPANCTVVINEAPSGTQTWGQGNNYWNGLILKKSEFDQISIAKLDATEKANAAKFESINYAKEKTKKIIDASFDTALFAKVDKNDQVIELTDEEGGLHLVGLQGTVQSNLEELEPARTISVVERDGVTHVFTDNNENVVAYLKADGGLYLANLDGSIQTQVAKLNTKIKNLDEVAQSDVSHVFTDSNENVIAYIKNDGKLHIVGLNNALQTHITSLENRATTLEVELQKLRDEVSVDEVLIEKELVPQNYSIDADQALTIKCDYPSNIQGFFPDSPYRLSDSPTHPCVIELARPLRGYKYLMVQTPYYENRPEEENPCVYGSNDMATWKMLEDMPQPLDETPTWDEALDGKKGYLSDPWWTYDHITKELYCCYRKAYTVGDKTYNLTDIMQLLYRKTSNGINWTKPQKLFNDTQNGVDPLISPAIIYDFKNHVWCMFYFKSIRGFAMRTNPDFRNPNTWSDPIDLGYESWIAANNPPQLGWHLDVRYIGDRLFAMINDSSNAKLYMAYADKDDLTQWTFTSNSVLNTPPPRNSCYKGSFIAVPVDETQMKMHVVWTDAGGYRRLYNAQTFPISIT